MQRTSPYPGGPGIPSNSGNVPRLHKPTNSVDLAEANLKDAQMIKDSILERDSNGNIIQPYVAHTAIIADKKYPSFRPPTNSPQEYKEDRYLILTRKPSGRMFLNRAKENKKMVLIGRSWDFDELTQLTIDDEVPTGFICTMGKDYYWEVHTPKERRRFLKVLLENYIHYTGGNLPKLINCSIDYFHLERIYNSYHGGPAASPRVTSVSSRSPIKATNPVFNNNGMHIEPSSPTKSSVRNATAAALAGGLAKSASFKKLNDNRVKLEQARKQLEAQENEKKQTAIEDERKQAETNEIEMRRKKEIAKRRELELERRRKQKELELQQAKADAEAEQRAREEAENKAREEAKERARIEALAREQAKAEAEARNRAKIQAEAEAKATELENARLEQARLQKQSLEQQQFQKPRNISYSHNDASFEYGDESRFQQSKETLLSNETSGIDTYLEDYVNEGDDNGHTAPLNLIVPQPRNNDNYHQLESPQLTVPEITTTLEENENDLDVNNYDGINGNGTLPIKRADSTIDKVHRRSRAFSRSSVIEPDNNDDLLELLEEIGYDPLLDDSASLQNKILSELDRLQYNKIQTITDVTSATSTLKNSILSAFSSCNHIDPILSVFGVQISAFKDDVDYIESQGHGLQVKATNEKLLMNELNELVHSVEISDTKLQKLLGMKITLSYGNSELEQILNELYSALLKTSGTGSDMKTNVLSEMNALKEKKDTFEYARNKFISNLKKYCSRIFESVALSLTSKLEQLDVKQFDTNFLKSVFLDKLSSLLTLSGLISFVKRVSPKDFGEMVDDYIEKFKNFFNNLSITLFDYFNKQLFGLNIIHFSFDDYPASFVNKEYMSFKNKKGMKLQLDTISDGSVFVNLVKSHLSNLLNVISIEQELVKNLFGFSSSSEYLFENLIKTSIEERCSNFKSISNYFSGSIENDRLISDDIFEIMKGLFEDAFSATIREFAEASKGSNLSTPALLSFISSICEFLAPTNNEFSYTSFTKFKNKIDKRWSKEVEQQIQIIMSSKLTCHITNYIKAYPAFFDNVHMIMDSMDMDNIITFGVDQKVPGNYYSLWDAIKNSLYKSIDSLKIEAPLVETLARDENDIDGNVLLQKHLTLWINYRWIVEESKHLRDFPKDLSKSIDNAREYELRSFTEAFGKLFSINDVIKLLENVDGSPENFSSYSYDSIKAMMIPFKGDKFKQEIADIGMKLKTVLKGRCYYLKDKTKENDYSVLLGQNIEKELYNQCMSALCQLYITTFNSFTVTINKYYANFEVPLDKSLIQFYFKKNYI